MTLPLPTAVDAKDVEVALEKRERIRNTISLLTDKLEENEASTWPNIQFASIKPEE